jgi:hypothetical protein
LAFNSNEGADAAKGKKLQSAVASARDTLCATGEANISL